MIDYLNENRFLISIFENNRISTKFYCSRRLDKAVNFQQLPLQIPHA